MLGDAGASVSWSECCSRSAEACPPIAEREDVATLAVLRGGGIMRRSAMFALAGLVLAGCSGAPEPTSGAESSEEPVPEPSATVPEAPADEPPENEPAEDSEELDTLRVAAVSLAEAALDFTYMNAVATAGGGTEEGCPDMHADTRFSLSEIEDLPSAKLRVAVADMKSAATGMAIACMTGFTDDLKDDWDAAHSVAKVELEPLIIDAGG
jgi:hypothetical protein